MLKTVTQPIGSAAAMASAEPSVRFRSIPVGRRAFVWRVVALLVVLLHGTALAAEPASLEQLRERLDQALQQTDPSKSRVAAVVLDPLDGRVLYANTHATEAFIPASNLKLLTTATTLHLYGPDHQLGTVLAIAGDDLLVIGQGDPAFGDPTLAARDGRTPMSVLDDWADALRDAGVRQIPGDLVVVDPVFDDQLVHPTWSAGNRLQWYGAPVAGVSFNDNCVDFTFVPTGPGRPAEVQTLPPAGGFVVQGQVETRPSKGKHNPVLGKRADPVDGQSVYLVRGGVTQRAGPYSKPVDDPRRFLGEVLRAHLQRRGIEIAGELRLSTGLSPDQRRGLRVIAEHRTPLTDVLGRVNANSQNLMAEALAKLNGLALARHRGEADPRGSWAGGHDAAVAFLQSRGLDTLSVVAADGSGLSRENRLSADVLARLLGHMLAEHPHGEYFLDSLAVSGVKGSLSRRMTQLKGRVFGKTGTINGVSTLSGYVFSPQGSIAVFSILHNGSASGFRDQQDAAVAGLADWLATQPPVTVRDPEILEAQRQVGLVAADNP